MNNTEKVGVLLVHGVGEQTRFEHLNNEIRHLVSGLKALPGVKRVSVSVNSSRDSHYQAKTELWKADQAAPVRVDVNFPDRRVEIHVHEVWWADLDDPVTVKSQAAFWGWGLYQWNAKRFEKTKLDGAKHMRLPLSQSASEPVKWYFHPRARLFAVGTVFLLGFFALELINIVSKRVAFGRIPKADILFRYVGDVKLFQQRARIGSGHLEDLNQPPRVAIRRRMVRAMVDVALEGYDRWFVLAHSLGTVLAWNGLMESAHCLPNYLDRERWEQCMDKGLAVHKGDPYLLGETDEMRPPRPGWLDDGDIIKREKLFEKCQGFLTYGSPLDKFAYLWPRIVPINQDNEAVFPSGFEWINVYDNADPVSASLDAFDPQTPSDDHHAAAKPSNHSFDASKWLLIGHLKYLDFKAGKTGRLVNRVAEWLISGNQFRKPTPGEEDWLTPEQEEKKKCSRIFQWGVAAVVLAGIIAGLVVPAIAWLWQSFSASDASALSYACTSVQSGADPIECLVPIADGVKGSDFWNFANLLFRIPLYVSLAALVVWIFGVVGRMLEERKNE